MRESSCVSVSSALSRSLNAEHLSPAYRSLRLALLLAATLLLTSHGTWAQTTNAGISGRVTDQQNGVIPGVDVVAKNVDTGVEYPTKTNSEGFYSLPNIPPGNYLMTVQKTQFRSVTATGITLHVQDALSRNFSLQVGSSSESVTVTADQNNIDTTDGTVSTTIDRNFAENLPLNGRSFQTLMLLVPGTVQTPDGNDGGTFSINGQRANANSFSVDGISANVGGFFDSGSWGFISNGANPSFTIAGTTQGMVSVDALQEFKIQTSSYAPEFGRQPGGQVSLLTRSGTNEFHGTAFDYLRNDALDANNWFSDEQGLPKGKERQNDFGGTFGGPVLKDKTFLFVSYEGLRLLEPMTQVVQVPSLCMRGTGPCLQGEQPAAVAFQPILNSFPIPDGPESVDSNGNPTGSAPYTFSASAPTTIDSGSIKIDHNFGGNIHLFGRYAETSSNQQSFDYGNLLNGVPFTQRLLTLGFDSHIYTNLYNEFRVNYTVNVSTVLFSQYVTGGAKAFDPSILYPKPLMAGPDGSGFVLTPLDSFFVIQNGSDGKSSQRQINIVDNVSYVRGTHSLKWGVDYRRLFPILGRAPLIGSYSIDSESDLVAGVVSVFGVGSHLIPHPIYDNLSIFAQDTWRASGRVSVTYGLRWEFNPAPSERDGIQPLNVINLSNPATATLAPINSDLYKSTYRNFAPRVGLAYQIRRRPGEETVVRAGVGLFYDLNSETTAIGYDNAPFTNRLTISEIPFPVPDNVLAAPPVPAPLTPPYSSISAVDPNLKLPYTLQWNVSVEQALGQSQSITAAYVGSAGDRLLRSDNLFDFGPSINGVPSFADVTVVRNASSSNYQALQLQFNRHLSHRLQALASYTYSHSIDNSSNAFVAYSASLAGNIFLNPNVDRGNSDFDLRHAFRGALTYSIPTWTTNESAKAALNGWSVDMIGLAQTGLPVNLIGGFYSESALPDGFFELRPNVIPGKPLYVYGSQCVAANNGAPCPGGMGFNPAAFEAVPTDSNGNPTQVQGTLGRNVMRGLGAWEMDFSLHRQFDLTERFKLQFRSEFFNIFNHPNFGPPTGFLCGSGCFGLATATLNSSYNNGGEGLNSLYAVGGPRSIQLALKLLF